jgi:hypothetical protein
MGYYTGGDYYMAGGLWEDIKAGASRMFAGGSERALSLPGGSPLGGGGLGFPQLTPGALRGVAADVEAAGGRVGNLVTIGGRRRYRRMNPLNPRALRRALSRARSFEKFARRTITITSRMKFKKGARGRRR